VASTLTKEEPALAPHPGSQAMPRWTTGELIDVPRIGWRNILAIIGPGIVMSASAIGGGEWLLGPTVTARYGGAMLWLATLSIVFQALYNIEISRYTLYCGEPIFSGKFRTPPGPMFWLFLYLLLDFSVVFPYLAASAATPIQVILLGGQLPDPEHVASHWWLAKISACVIFLLAMIPLVVGGKIFNSLRVVMSAKLVIIFGFLLILAIFYSHFSTWTEIGSGFFKFGTIPVRGDNASNTQNVFTTLLSTGKLPPFDFGFIAFITAMAAIAGNGGLSNTPMSNYIRDQGWGMGHHVGAIPSFVGGRGIGLSHVGCVFEVNGESLPRWRRWVRKVMREQLLVWMPACFVGLALPSMLSVEFLKRGTEAGDWNAAVMTAEGVRQHVAEPSPGVLAYETGVSKILHGPAWGNLFWGMTLFCGFLVLSTTLVSTTDGIIRRWVDVFWTASRRLREVDPEFIRHVYFGVLVAYVAFGIVMLWLNKPAELIKWATLGFNFALGFSCWHTLVINALLLPRELRPGWFMRAALVLGGVFFNALFVVTLLNQLGAFQAAR
jgi:hypothetical protein